MSELTSNSGPHYDVRIEPVDIARWQGGNTGTEFVWSFEADRPGPHVMVNAVTHGNELCGAIAVDLLLREKIRPRRGRLTLSFANVEAYGRFDPDDPTASRYVEEDLNRVWSRETLDGPRDSAELRRARALRPVVDTVDHMLDIHSMQHAGPALSLCGMPEKGRHLAAGTGIPQWVVSDRGHAAGLRLRDYGPFGEDGGPRAALLIECGQHWRPETVDLAIQACFRFLLHLETIEPAAAADHQDDAPAPSQRFVVVTEAVTIRSENFAFVGDYRGMEIVAEAGTVIGMDGDEAVRTPHDDCIMVMPSQRLRKGLTAVRFGRFVE